ncbi:hypothetical protein SVAN01_09356 [Stagonosporopsis vannaccii]|nr:hypothetical protein SVAN01_09356 [Stagonosporopsis vannaccii]
MRDHISVSAVTHGLRAVGSALSLDSTRLDRIVDRISAIKEAQAIDTSWTGWTTVAKRLDAHDPNLQPLVQVAVALAFLRDSARQEIAASREDLDQIWNTVKDVLQDDSLPWRVKHGADGSRTIALWCIIKDGRVEESLSLRIWLPDECRKELASAIHMRSRLAQGWVLAGESRNCLFTVMPAGSSPTHTARTSLLRDYDHDHEDFFGASGGVGEARGASGHEGVVCLSETSVELHHRDDCYHIRNDDFHTLWVEPDAIYAELFLLGPGEDNATTTTVLKPFLSKGSAKPEQPAEALVPDIASLVVALRSWEHQQEVGSRFSDRGDWEEALRAYRTALHTCQNNRWLNMPRYKHVTLGAIGKMYRMLGRYSLACKSLEETVIGTPHSQIRIDCAGELATIYRHMDRLEDSERVAEEQYQGAVELDLPKFACRAIGIVGVLNYQLYLQNGDEALLSSAISQLNERVERARQIGDVVLEAIGSGRLSLCYIAKGDHEESVRWAEKNYHLTCLQHDATKTGFARAFLGRALLFAGRRDEALAVINAPGGCSPVIALCNEISGEHRQYINDLIGAGADLKLRDERGYSALECTVYNGDRATTTIIEKGLQAQILREGGNVVEEIAQLKYEAILRKGYRDIFQDKLRPVLLRRGNESTLQALRQTYASSLAEDTEKKATFDGFKYVPYVDFLRCGRLPRSSDGYTREVVKGYDISQVPYILFFSYRWIGKEYDVGTAEPSPDNPTHTQYKRMLKAIEQFLNLHHDVDRDHLGIWIDFACVDQDYQKPGVAALPMNLAQCNAMISLTDEDYYNRSWCCVEVLILQVLRKAYDGLYLWYEHIDHPTGAEKPLRPGPANLVIDMSTKDVTDERDRPKLLFLERQMRLLG